jgi:uncharacterized protein YaiL (DUF2058 family)
MSDLLKALKQAGVVNDKQARRASHEKQQAKRRGEDDINCDAKRLAEEAENLQKSKTEAAQKNLQAQKQRQERLAQLENLLDSHALPRENSEVSYFYKVGNKIKEIFISRQRAKQLGEGRLALIYWQEETLIVTKETYQKASYLANEIITLLAVWHDPAQELPDDR